jgi:hypothetical protein
MREGESVLPLALGFASFVAACAPNEGNFYEPRADAGTTSQLVGPSGGTVTADDGTTVVIPAGALTQDVTITITPNPFAATLTQAQPLAVQHLFGPEGQHFLKTVSVTLAFDPANLPPGAKATDVAVYSAPSDSNFYQPLRTMLADSTHVTGLTTDFCNMVPGATSSGTVIVGSATVKIE